MAEIYNTNLQDVAAAYIRQLKIPDTASSVKQQLDENPYFPSLYLLTNTFERFHIPYQTVTIDKENFDNLTPPFIVYVKGLTTVQAGLTTGKDFVLVTSVTENEVQYIAENKKNLKN